VNRSSSPCSFLQERTCPPCRLTCYHKPVIMKTHASPINLSVICRLATDTISFTVKISYYTTIIINKLILTTEFVALTEQLWEKNRVKRISPARKLLVGCGARPGPYRSSLWYAQLLLYNPIQLQNASYFKKTN
jgi:hypothetical protein